MNRSEYKQTFSPHTLLFVEDDVDILQTLTYILKKYFKAVYPAHNGIEGLALYKEHHPTIVLSDITMRQMDGITMAHELRAVDEDMKIIFATGHNEACYLDQLHAFGNHTLIKPIDVETLFDMIIPLLPPNATDAS
jgi:CheY-like chemotaxis protein